MCRWYSPGYVRLCYRKGVRRGQRVAMTAAAWQARTTRCYSVERVAREDRGQRAALLAFAVPIACHPADVDEMRRYASADEAVRAADVVTLRWTGRRKRIAPASIVERAQSFGWRAIPVPPDNEEDD